MDRAPRSRGTFPGRPCPGPGSSGRRSRRRFYFRVPARKIDPKRDDCQPFHPDLIPELANLLFIQEQPPLAQRLMIEPAGGIVRRNVAIDQPSLAPVFNLNVGFADADLSGADRFNFRPLKRQPGFVRFQNKVFEPRFPVRRDSFLTHALYFSTTPPQRRALRAALFPPGSHFH